MSTEKVKKIERRGGAREGTGPKPGSGEKTKICVSVTASFWQSSLSIWKRQRKQRKASWLVDRLVKHYVSTGGSVLETEAAI